MIAICKDNNGFSHYLTVGNAYKVMEQYYCRYDQESRIIVKCHDGDRDFPLRMFMLRKES